MGPAFHRGPAAVNFIHELFRPPDCIIDCTHCGGYALPTVPLREFSGCKDRSRDKQHALAAFIHFGMVHLSPCFRYNDFRGNSQILE